MPPPGRAASFSAGPFLVRPESESGTPITASATRGASRFPGRRKAISVRRPRAAFLKPSSLCPALKKMFGVSTWLPARTGGPFTPCRSRVSSATTRGIGRKATVPIAGAAWHWMKCGALRISPPVHPNRTSSAPAIAVRTCSPIASWRWMPEPAPASGISRKSGMTSGTWTSRAAQPRHAHAGRQAH